MSCLVFLLILVILFGMTTPDFAEYARTYLAGARQAVADYDEIRSREHTPRQVAQVLDRINHSFKLSEICAHVAIADRLADLVDLLEAGEIPGIKGRPLAPEKLDADYEQLRMAGVARPA